MQEQVVKQEGVCLPDNILYKLNHMSVESWLSYVEGWGTDHKRRLKSGEMHENFLYLVFVVPKNTPKEEGEDGMELVASFNTSEDSKRDNYRILQTKINLCHYVQEYKDEIDKWRVKSYIRHNKRPKR